MMACTCYWTDPSTWFYHYGIPEPASTREWNPDCPQHGDTPIERETAFALGRWSTGIHVAFRGTPGPAEQVQEWQP